MTAIAAWLSDKISDHIGVGVNGSCATRLHLVFIHPQKK
jgi:hypothetical protein